MKCAYFVYCQYCCKEYATVKKKYGYCDLTEYRCKMLYGAKCKEKINSSYVKSKVRKILNKK